MANDAPSRKSRRSDGFSRRRRRADSDEDAPSASQDADHHSNVEIVHDFRSKRALEAEQDESQVSPEERERLRDREERDAFAERLRQRDEDRTKRKRKAGEIEGPEAAGGLTSDEEQDTQSGEEVTLRTAQHRRVEDD